MRRVVASSLLLLMACSRQAPPPEAVQVAPAGPAPAPPASGLPIHRGVLVLTAESPRLTPCGETAPREIEDATGGDLSTAYEALASEQTGEMWVELRAEDHGGALVARELVRAQPVTEGDPCEGLLPGELHALGQEPSWSVTIRASGIEWLEPGMEAPIVFPSVAPVTDGSRRTWTTELPGNPPRRLELLVAAVRCRDTMSGAWYGLAAEGVLDKRSLQGCAYARE